jgi:hypothetical protein
MNAGPAMAQDFVNIAGTNTIAFNVMELVPAKSMDISSDFAESVLNT